MRVLADEDRSDRHRNDDLHDEDHGRDLRGVASLQRAHLGQEPDAGRHAGGDPPHQRGPCVARVQGVGHELGGQAAPGERCAGAERRQAAAPAQRERDERHAGDGGQDAGQRDGAGVPGGDVGGDRAEQHDAGHDGRHRRELAPADTLAEMARADHEQEDQAERQGRLDDGQRREQQRGRMQGPAEQVEPGAQQPAAPADEADEQRRAQALVLRRIASVKRLQGETEVVERRCGAGRRDAEQERGHHALHSA